MATIDQVGLPFSGTIYGCEEASYKGGMTADTEWLSDSVTAVRLESGDINRSFRDISGRAIKDFSKTLVNPKLQVEYIWQGKSTASDLTLSKMNAVTNGVLKSYAFEIGASTNSSVASSWFVCKGCTLDKTNIKATTGENYIITLDFDVGEVSTPSDTAAGTAPTSTVSADYAAFNRAGSITWTGLTLDSYYVTKGLDLTISNNVEPYWDVGSTAKVCALPTSLDVTGTCDISMDGGGGSHWTDVVAGTDITSIVFTAGLGAGTEDTITLTDGRFDSTKIAQETSGAGMFDNVPFTFKTCTFSA